MTEDKARDSIAVEGMIFYGYHGANQAERELGQRFVVDLEVKLDLRRAGESDDLADTVNYAELYRAAREVLEGTPVNLLEHLGERICHLVLQRHPVSQVRVRIQKPNAPIRGGIFAHSAVEIVRRREG